MDTDKKDYPGFDFTNVSNISIFLVNFISQTHSNSDYFLSCTFYNTRAPSSKQRVFFGALGFGF